MGASRHRKKLMFFHAVDQCFTADIQVARGASLVPAMSFQGLAQNFLFDLFQVYTVVRQFEANVCDSRLGRKDFRGQVFGSQQLRF